MRSTVSLAALLVAVFSAPAPAAELKYFFCFTPVLDTSTVYYSDRQDIGPVSERAGYGEKFTEVLRLRRLVSDNRQSYCNMRSTVAEIERDQEGLRTDCRVCGDAKNFVLVSWNHAEGDMEEGWRHRAELAEAMNQPQGSGIIPDQGQGQDGTGGSGKDGDKKEPEEEIPYEIPAGLSSIVNLPLGRGWMQVHTRFFICGSEIRLSYSIIPPFPQLKTVRFAGTTFGNHKSYHFLDPSAEMVPGHRLGCAYQTRFIAKLADHEKDLVQSTFTDGTKAWSRLDMLRHMLGRFSVFAVEHAPYP